MPLSYSWLTYAQLRAALAQRLADPTNKFWADAENGVYINESLQTWQALTGTWQVDYVFPTDNRTWYQVQFLTGSPRARTVTDTQLYTMIEYHLLEPATGSVWTGTSQFSIEDLTAALQGTQEEIIQTTGCNLEVTYLSTTPGTRRTYLPDNTLEVRRARWLPSVGDNVTLWRNDSLGMEYFNPEYLQRVEQPTEYNVMDGPPLTFNVDHAPNTVGQYELIVARTGSIFAPPIPITMAIPNDWTWLTKWGALAELLGRDSEATDRLRAQYCQQRYEEGLEMMQNSPWILYGRLNNVPVDTASVYEMDSFATEWDSNPKSYPSIVAAGIDLVAVSPVNPTVTSGVGITVAGNAPLPVADTDFVQISQDVADAILDYGQHIASFKQGGSEFTDTVPLYRNFIDAAAKTNSRITELGIFRDLQFEQGLRQDENQERGVKETVK